MRTISGILACAGAAREASVRASAGAATPLAHVRET
jgi:hypothetical protein